MTERPFDTEPDHEPGTDVGDTDSTVDSTANQASDQSSDQTSEDSSDETSGAAVRHSRRELELRGEARSGPSIPVDEFRRRSRRSFLTGAAGIVGAGLVWRWVQTQSTDDGIPQVLRDTLERNESIWSNLSQGRSAPEYDISDASPIQVNGRIGIRDDIDLASWTVQVEGTDGELLDEFGISTFEALPQHDLVIEHKCIEGWSNITHWGGARFRDFHARYADRVSDAKFVQLETPDGRYYVGWDIESILHPQTLLAMREGGSPSRPGARRPAAAGHAEQVRHQMPETDRHDPLHHRTTERLLGPTQLRLVRRALTG